MVAQPKQMFRLPEEHDRHADLILRSYHEYQTRLRARRNDLAQSGGDAMEPTGIRQPVQWSDSTGNRAALLLEDADIRYLSQATAAVDTALACMEFHAAGAVCLAYGIVRHDPRPRNHAPLTPTEVARRLRETSNLLAHPSEVGRWLAAARLAVAQAMGWWG